MILHYVYAFCVESNGDVTPLHPWVRQPGEAWGTRPKSEKPVGQVLLPEGKHSTVPKGGLPGVTTMVAFARPKPLRASDADIRAWFKDMPRTEAEKDDMPRYFDNYLPPVRGDPRAPRTLNEVATRDPYLRWQEALKQRVGDVFPFQRSVSFSQGDGK